MRKKYRLIFEKKGDLNYNICDLISHHNAGKQYYSMSDIEIILRGKQAEYPSLYRNLSITHMGDELIVSEDGENVTAIIQIF